MDDVEKYFKNLVIKKSFNYDKIIKSINIVQRYVQKKQLIVVGGQSIDYAIRIKGGEGLYDKGSIPDIDIISDEHFEDAYAIALLLKKADITGISVINALHPTTMKVRVDFQEVCDITYMPTHILNAVPTLFYKGYKISHPYYQYVDQHRALSYPLENPPLETILNRGEKDMVRYDLLYEYYPLHMKHNIPLVDLTSIVMNKSKISLDKLNNQCISGFAALNYWIGAAKKMGFKPEYDFGATSFDSSYLEYSLPTESYGLTVYSDNIKDFIDILQVKGGTTFYTRFLDKLPRKMLIGNNFEIFDNKQKIAAHEFNYGKNKIFIANMQHIMFYLLVQYVLVLGVTNNDKQLNVFYKAYMTCRDMFIWASSEFIKPDLDKKRKDELMQFMPTVNTYGEHNVNASLALRLHNFGIKNQDFSKTEKFKFKQPYNVYDADMRYGKIPKKYMEFDKSDSEAFAIGGTVIESFLENGDLSGL